jgi:transposase
MIPEYCIESFPWSSRCLGRPAVRGAVRGLRDFSGFDSCVVTKTGRNDLMAWAEITRRKHQRDGLRYASDTADEEWRVIEPHPPPPAHCRRTHETSLRDVVDAIFYIAQTGGQWRLLPKDFPPYTTVQRHFCAWRDNGVWQAINHVLLMDVREAAGREVSPTAGVIDSQSVKTTESGGPRGYAVEKMIKGRKRHILTDTIGLLVGMIVHPPTSRIVAVHRACWRACLADFPGSVMSLPTPPTRAASSRPHCKGSASGRWKSSSGRMLPKALFCCPGVGLWIEHLPD